MVSRQTKDSIKPIEAIQVGDLVLSRDETTGDTTWKPVVQLFHNQDKAILRVTFHNAHGGTETLGVTAEHPFHVDGKGWVQAGQLQIGDVLSSWKAGETQTVQAITHDSQHHDTYNFEVADYHTYFVGNDGVWVHNSCYDDLAGFLGNMSKGEFDRLASRWNKGTFNSLQDSLTYHVSKHGENMDLARYLRQADAFSTKGVRSISVDNGGSKYIKNGKYIIFKDKQIVSYGGIND